MSDQRVLPKDPFQLQLRAELEAMVLGDLLGPADREGGELIERMVQDRYLVGVIASSRFVNTYGWNDLYHDFPETKQCVRFTISEPARREVFLKLNHEHYAEEVKQGLHVNKGAAKNPPPIRKRPACPPSRKPAIFDGEDDE